MPSRKVYVKDQSKLVWHNDFVLVQSGHVDTQSVAWVGLTRVERDALDRARCLHGTQCLLSVTREEVI